METVGIIGQGRFGQLLKTLLESDFNVVTYDKQIDSPATLTRVLAQETVFIATPIRHLESVIRDIAGKLVEGALVIDVCSVKVHAATIMQHYLPEHVDILATHPLFGPDSYETGKSSTIVCCNIRDQAQRYWHWKRFFEAKNLHVLELSAEEHDRMMAKSQSLTHLLGRGLKAIDAAPTGLDTQGYQQLLRIMTHTCNDSWELFYDLQRYNPFATAQNQQFLEALQDLMQKIATPDGKSLL